MREDKPRFGPWLRHYGQEEQKSLRDRVVEIALGAGAAIVFLVILAGVLMAFLRFPIWTFAGLLAVWAVGLAVLMVRKRRVAIREELLRRSQAHEEGDERGSEGADPR